MGQESSISRIKALEVVASANASVANDLASEITRLKTHIASLQAELQSYQHERTPIVAALEQRIANLQETLEQRIAKLQEENGLLAANAADTARSLQKRENELARTQRELAALSEQMERLRGEQAVVAQRAARIEEQSRLLSEGRSEPVYRLLQDVEAELTRTQIQIATLSAETGRLQAERSILSHRAARLEEHNQLLIANATQRERKLQGHERELTRASIQIATLAPDNSRLRAEHSVISQRAAAVEGHNRLLTESATDTARKLQQCEVELTQARIEIATLAPENQRLHAERVIINQRTADLESHNRLLVETATDATRDLYAREAELTQARVEIATLAPENERLRAEHAVLFQRAARLEEQNRLITESATEAVRRVEEQNRLLTESATAATRKLQEIRQTDYQIVMAQQQMLAGMKDADPGFHEVYEKCRSYTMTSVERLYALYKSVEYIVSAGIDGDFAEAGVWRGGSCMLIAETLLALGERSRRIFLFDTFGGHPRPDADKDVDLWGNRAIDEWQRRIGDDQHGEWAYASLDEVRGNLATTNYPADKLVFVPGLLEETARETRSIDKLALLRLDTDWYDSTKAGLEHLFPRLASGGVLIVDDYGHYKGQQVAVDEYLTTANEPILLNRIDYSCRLGVKR